MKGARWAWFLLAVSLLATARLRADDGFDRLGEQLTWTSRGAQARARVNGSLDWEAYALPDPVPGVIEAEHRTLLNPRLTLGVDAQLGDRVYGFVQARVDRGFDPASDPLEARVDEYAVRWTPDASGRFTVQAGKFATVVGNWNARHDSWTNPFITAPLPYENLTGVWDNEPPRSVSQLLLWSHVKPGLSPEIAREEKYLRLPIVWGPSYTTGLAVAGELDRFRYALEVKNASLSSRPEAWSVRESRWSHPTVSGRLRYVPDPRWEFGWSASTGTYLRPGAAAFLPASRRRGEYRQVVFGQDLSYARHHLQVWAEVYAARFQIPGIGDADTIAYYVETKYKFTPQWSGALRWNQQFYGRLAERGVRQRWGRDLWRVDLAPTFRLSPHSQIKLQYSVQEGDLPHTLTHLGALQATVWF